MSEYLSDDIEAVLFDHDDTLVGTIEAKWVQHRHVARTWYGKELSDEEIRTHWGKPLRALFGLLYETEDIDEAMEYSLACHKCFPKRLFVDTIPTLEAIHQSGRKIGVITATSRFSLEHDIDLLGIPREVLDYTQTEEDTVYHKPDPRVFEPAKQWLEGFDIAPQNTLYVGDGLHDRNAAHEAGFRFIGVETGLVTAHEFNAAGVLCVSSLAKLLGRVPTE